MKYYLAHPFLIKDKIRKWQLKIEKENNITFLNPFIEGSDRKLEIENKFAKNIKTKEDSKYLVDYDISCVKKTDGTLAIIDGSTSYGTIMEICYAYNEGKDVYIICTNGYHKHPWIQSHSKKIFKSFKEAEEWLKKI